MWVMPFLVCLYIVTVTDESEISVETCLPSTVLKVSDAAAST